MTLLDRMKTSFSIITCMQMFIVVVFITVKKREQPKCLSGVDLQNVVRPYSGLAFGNEKEWTTDGW